MGYDNENLRNLSHEELIKKLNSINMSKGSLADLQTAADIIDLLYLDQDKIRESADFRALDETGKLMYMTMAAKTGTITYAVLLDAVKDNKNISREAAEQFKKGATFAASVVSVTQDNFMSKAEVFAESGGKISSAMKFAKALGPLIEGYARSRVVIHDNEKWLRELVGYAISVSIYAGAVSLATKWIVHPGGQGISWGAAALKGGGASCRSPGQLWFEQLGGIGGGISF